MMSKPWQDYAIWDPPRGNAVYTTKEDWEENDCQWAQVDLVDGKTVTCIDCYTVYEVYKLTCDTPGFLHTPEGLCLSCLRKQYGKDVKYKDGKSC